MLRDRNISSDVSAPTLRSTSTGEARRHSGQTIVSVLVLARFRVWNFYHHMHADGLAV